MNTEINEDTLLLPIEILKLNLRTYRILKQRNVITLLDVITLGENGLAGLYQLGKKQISYIFEKLNDFMIQSQGITLAEIRSKIPIDDPRPFLYTVDSSVRPNLVQAVIPFLKVLLNDLKYQNDYEILKRRYGFEKSKVYTLQEVGDYFRISRERVRQIEERAKEKIQQTLTGSFDTKKWRIPKNIIDEANELFSLLRNYDVVITEHEALKIMQNHYGGAINENDLGSIRFWLSLSGLEALPKATRETVGISLVPSWILVERIEKSSLFKVLNIVYRILLDEIKPVSKFDIFVQLNGKLKKKIESNYLDYVSKICLEIQKTDDDTYEFRFESLPSIADKTYRVLYEANKPLHIRDILREINHLQVKTGGQANAKARTLQQQLGGDSRFEPIGRSGEWSLIEWKHIAKETFLELMQEFLHLKQAPATAKEIFNYVYSKREGVKLNSVQSFLFSQKSIFTRVAYGKYGLTAWGLKPVPSERSRFDGVEIYAQIDSVTKAIFANKNTDKLPLGSIVADIKERTGRSATTIRKIISELPYLEFEQHPTYPQRKYLKYLEEGQQKVVNTKTGRLPKTLIRDNVQNEVKDFLLQQRENSAPLSVIAAHVIKKTGCIKPTFYHYLSEMENIRKSYEDSAIVCKLIEVNNANALFSFPQIDTANDIVLKDNLTRAVSNFKIDNIDLGLFQLGKIFESELRSFLTQAKSKNAFPVTSKDLGRLVDMIDCVEKNKVITKKYNLTLLREHRNERAHGDVPDIGERQKLMQYAPFLGDLYINCIILLNDKRQKL